jgi:hypothetical protein
MFTEEKAIASARQEYRVFFTRMATEGLAWHLHKTGSGVTLMRADAAFDVPLPIIVRNVHAMTEQTMVNALSAALRRAA